MLDLFKNELKDAIRYPFIDWKNLIIIGTLMFAITISNKANLSKIDLAISILESLIPNYFNSNTIILIISVILLFLEMGYGSKIVYKGLLGENKPPKLNKIKKLVWEGFKKYCIVVIYGIVMTLLLKHAKSYFLADDIPLAIVFFILFNFVYLVLVGALLNRYESKGKFIKAFHYKEIFGLMKDIGAKDVFTIFICAVIGQIFVVSGFVDITEGGLTLFEIGISILTFFLAPISLISTKRLISLNLRRVYAEKDKKLKSSEKEYLE
ncbi:DUF4013 domain-containing protein [Methanobrevibacter sp.]|uniref:DUF4013 domain-containing protein n=1 Tax=Methanobrevibacter sp. TaxID=66852 RepID=UPI0025E7650B|nr:DUF4013 domain-containing protein [Methanobrevibacter sp.]MBQ2962380.1 DUF4013 domain-containing protein [Methanobrevibacter sp.]